MLEIDFGVVVLVVSESEHMQQLYAEFILHNSTGEVEGVDFSVELEIVRQLWSIENGMPLPSSGSGSDHFRSHSVVGVVKVFSPETLTVISLEAEDLRALSLICTSQYQ